MTKKRLRISQNNISASWRNSGYSLVETMIVVSIFSMVIIMMFNIFDRYLGMYSLAQTQVDAVNQSGAAMNEINRYASQSYRVLASASVNGTNYSSTASTLVLQLPSVNSSGDVIVNAWDYAVFRVSGTNLFRELQANVSSKRYSARGSHKIGDSVQSLAFTYNDVDFTKVTQVTAEIKVYRHAGKQENTSHTRQTTILMNYQ